MIKKLLIPIFCGIASLLLGQKLDHEAGQFILQLKQDVDILSLQKSYTFIERTAILSADLNIFHLFFDVKSDEKALLHPIAST